MRLELKDWIGHKDIYDLDPLVLPIELAGSSVWDEMEPERLDLILGGMLRNAVKRAKANVPLYRDNELWQEVDIRDINSIKNLIKLPLISKDSVPGTGSRETKGISGFRKNVIDNPFILVPDNREELLRIQEENNPSYSLIRKKYSSDFVSFGSGGSQGGRTSTLLSYLTIEAEAYALSRCLSKNGFRRGEKVACFYAPTHKGGLQLERSADIMGMEFHSKNAIFSALSQDYPVEHFKRALENNNVEDIGKFGKKMREGIRNYIRNNKIDVIESVQPPAEFMDNNLKGNLLAFMNIYEEDPSAFSSVRHVFLTGFAVPKNAVKRLREDGKEVSTTWGSTEAMALATYPKCSGSTNVNDLTETRFPTLGIIANYKERGLSKPRLEYAEEGLLVVTSLINSGSTYINYMIGDIALKTKKGFKDINRANPRPNITGSCASDALSI